MTQAKTPAKRTAKPRKTPASAKGKNEGIGRPSLLDPERQKVLIDAIRLGNPLKTAALFAGVNDSTIRKWRIKGEQALLIEKGRRNPTERKYAEFVTKLDAAIAEPAVRAQTAVHALMTMAFTGDTDTAKLRVIGDMAKFYLTHRQAKDYTTRIELTGADGGSIEVEADISKAWKQMQEIMGKAEQRGEDAA